MRFGDLYLTRLPNTSGAPGKLRPALVLFDLGADAVVCRVTTHHPRSPADVPLADWAPARLISPSIVRVDRLFTAEKFLLTRRIGAVTAADAATVRRTWNTQMRL